MYGIVAKGLRKALQLTTLSRTEAALHTGHFNKVLRSLAGVTENGLFLLILKRCDVNVVVGQKIVAHHWIHPDHRRTKTRSR